MPFVLLQQMPFSVRILCLVVLLMLWASPPVYAHNISAEFRLQEDKIEVVAFYDDESLAPGTKVTVTDTKENLIAQGRTNSEGIWHFPLPQPGQYQVKIDAGAGHARTIRVTVADSNTGEIDSDSPTRQEIADSRWSQLFLGLGTIGIIALGMLIAVHLRRKWVPQPKNAEATQTDSVS